jgi:hypothetical protein
MEKYQVSDRGRTHLADRRIFLEVFSLKALRGFRVMVAG